jgi:hypothetical protein
MKLLLIFTHIVAFVFSASQLHANYDSFQRNPDGTYVCGGAYNSFQRNPNGTYVCGWKKQKKQ